MTGCAIYSNSAYNGGGLAGGQAARCTVSNNSARGNGGGAFQAPLSHCTISGNQAGGSGGGAYNCAEQDCSFSNNWCAIEGGGTYNGGTPLGANTCSYFDNSASNAGGGAFVYTANFTFFSCSFVGNSTGGLGGGVLGGYLYSCILQTNSAQYGGGANSSALNNCLLVGNSAVENGGGLYGGNFNCCTLAENSAGASGGGSFNSAATNSIIYFNSAPDSSDCSGGTLYFSCTPTPSANGLNNITNDPLFINSTAGNLRLQNNSPCINSGFNLSATPSDLDWKPRVVGGTVDMGAYEFQMPQSVLSYAWLEQYGLPTDGSVDFLDLDGTGMNDYQKWIAGLNPTNAASVLMMLPPTTSANSPGVMVSWLSVNNRNYDLERATNLSAQPAFSIIQSNIPGSLIGTNTYADTNAVGERLYLYRVSVQR